MIGAKEFLVAITPKEYNRTAIIDVGGSLQKVVQKATRMNLATCWIGPGASHDSIKTELGDSKFNEDQDHIICVCAIGYKSHYIPTMINFMFQTMTNSRIPIHDLFSTEEDIDLEQAPFDTFAKVFEVCRWSPSSFNSQTTRCRVVLGDVSRIERFDFFCSTNSRFSRFYAPVALGIWLANFETGCQAIRVKGSFRPLQDGDRAVGSGGREDVSRRCDVSWVVQQ